MRNEDSSTVAIKNLVLISIIFFISIFTAVNFLSNEKVFSFAKTENESKVVTNKFIEEEKLEPQLEEVQVASVTSRSSDTVRTNAEIVEIENSVSIQDVTISRDMDLTVRTGLSKEDFKKFVATVKQDKSKFFYENSDIIYDMCEKYQLNEIFFCGLIAGESGWSIASNHRKTCNYISLMVNGKLKRFASVEDGLEQAAKALHNNYLTEGGKFYCGKNLSAVRTRFCPNSTTWVNLIYGCMSQMLANK